jgi:hypothetical protein
MSNETEKICTGCGRSSLNPIEEQYAACCPDNNYVTMNNKQQTAVEWFMEQIGEKQPNGFYVIDSLHDVQNVFQQAKEMEKEQMIEFGELVWKNLLRSDKIMKARDVYNETYGGNK